MGDALDAAVRSRNVPIVRFLFEKGANPNTRRLDVSDFAIFAAYFQNALHLAIALNEEDIVGLLIENGTYVYSNAWYHSNCLELALFVAHHRNTSTARNIATIIQQYFPTEDLGSGGMSSEVWHDARDCNDRDSNGRD